MKRALVLLLPIIASVVNWPLRGANRSAGSLSV